MQKQWMSVNGRFGSCSRAPGGVSLRSSLSSVALAIVAATAIGCGGTERVPDGDHFKDVVVIDNMEDGTQYILSDDGRTGLWYTYNDASLSGTQEPSQGFPMYQTSDTAGQRLPSSEVLPRACGGVGTGAASIFSGETQCEFVARTWGTGQRGWGAGIGVDLNGEGGEKNPIDASSYGGIGFFAIGNVRSNALRVNVQDVHTTPESAKAADNAHIERCEAQLPNGTLSGRCNDHYGYGVTLRADAWQWFQIPFHCMTSGGWGFPATDGVPTDNALLRSQVVGVQFQIQGADPADTGMLPAGATVMPFDFSIDNLSFLDSTLVNDSTPCSTTGI
jgi:hypothetical protein